MKVSFHIMLFFVPINIKAVHINIEDHWVPFKYNWSFGSDGLYLDCTSINDFPLSLSLSILHILIGTFLLPSLLLHLSEFVTALKIFPRNAVRILEWIKFIAHNDLIVCIALLHSCRSVAQKCLTSRILDLGNICTKEITCGEHTSGDIVTSQLDVYLELSHALSLNWSLYREPTTTWETVSYLFTTGL